MIKSGNIELLLIGTATFLLGFFGNYFPGTLSLGRIVLVVAVAIFAQSLIRDLYLVRINRDSLRVAKNKQAICGICLESAIGCSVLVAGGLLLFINVSVEITMPAWIWGVGGGCVFLFGYWLKSFVLIIKPLSIVRVKEHYDFIVFNRKS